MNYETFLFTRSQRRDFTAFIRPRGLTNKQVSVIASALGHVNDIAALTPDWPALYCFPIGDYVLLLRHYDSGRKHAGRNIAVLEGIAVRRTQARHFALALPHFLAHQDELLAVAAAAPDLETLAAQESDEYAWPDMQAVEAVIGAADELVNTFVARLAEDRLFVPFDDDGRALLAAALSDSRFPPLYFAFGTNSDVIARLNQAEIDVDIVSYFNTTIPSLRSRQTNEITSELADYISRAPRRPPPAPVADNPPSSLPTPRQIRDEGSHQRTVQDDPLAQFSPDDAEILTPRQMARRQAEMEQAATPQESHSPLAWFGSLIARLLGRK
jgi:hypothetical protein